MSSCTLLAFLLLVSLHGGMGVWGCGGNSWLSSWHDKLYMCWYKHAPYSRYVDLLDYEIVFRLDEIGFWNSIGQVSFHLHMNWSIPPVI